MKKTKKHLQAKTISGKQNIIKILYISFLIIFSIILLKNAWVGDDAYITFRTIDNFVNGHGLTWNTIDRVQAYTHPLWMFLMTFLYLLTGEFFLTVIAFSLVLTILAVLLVTQKIAKSNVTTLLVLLALMLSKSFVDYSISGLENPLIHLFIALFAYNFFKYETNPGSLFMLSLIAGLACLNRMDTILFFVPALIYAFWKIRAVKNFFIILAGFSPFIIWELFSLWYYGFLFPNTAYAKLSTGIGRSDLILQGLAYLKNALIMDPLSVVIIICGFVVTFISKERHKLSLSFGILLYLAYVVYIGGDFMSGRFLAAPFFCSVILLVQSKLVFTKRSLALIGIIILILISGPNRGRKYPGRVRLWLPNRQSAISVILPVPKSISWTTWVLQILYWPDCRSPIRKTGGSDISVGVSPTATCKACGIKLML